MHDLFLIYMYFINFYVFRAYLGPSHGGTIVRIQQLVLIIITYYYYYYYYYYYDCQLSRGQPTVI